MKGTKEDGKLLVLSGFPAPFSRYRERAVCGDTQKGKAREDEIREEKSIVFKIDKRARRGKKKYLIGKKVIG